MWASTARPGRAQLCFREKALIHPEPKTRLASAWFSRLLYDVDQTRDVVRAAVNHHNIRPLGPAEKAHPHGERFGVRAEAHRALEGAVAVPQPDIHVAFHGAEHSHVLVAVAVEIAHRHINRRHFARDRSGGAERSVIVTQ